MLQRIQTLLLALVVILGIVFSFLTIIEFSGYESTYLMTAYKVTELESGNVFAKNMGVGVLQGLVILISIIVIFLFKNRGLQMKLAKLNILLIALQIAAMVMYSDATKTAIGPNANDVLVSYKIAAVFPIISLILNYLAIRFIKKDDDLVRSADRLR